MTTITITGKQPGKTDVTISSTVNPAVKTVVPVTVLSRNLLSYGPASGNGLTATVNSRQHRDVDSAHLHDRCHRPSQRDSHSPPVQNRLTSLALCTIHSNHHERSHSLDGLEKIRSVGA